MDDAAAVPAILQWTRAGALFATLALIGLGLAWELWLAPTGHRTLVWKVLPLFFPIAGLARMRLYTYRWTSLLVWPYFAEGAVRATSERGAGIVLGAIEVLLSLVLFAACGMHVRAAMRTSSARGPRERDEEAPRR